MKLFFRKNNFFALLFVAIFIAATPAASAQQAASSSPRTDNQDLGMGLYWARLGRVVPDAVTNTLRFRGTGFPVSPLRLPEIAATIALQWIYGISPEGVQNYSDSDLTTDRQKAGAISPEQAEYYRSSAKGAVMLPNTPDKAPQDRINKTSYEKGIIKSLADLPRIMLGGEFGDSNSSTTDLITMAQTFQRTSDLLSVIDSNGGALPEPAGIRDIGKNTSHTGQQKSPFANLGELVASASGKTAQLALSEWLPALAIMANPDGGDIPVSEGKLPSNLANAKQQQNVKSAQVTGTGEFTGRNAQVAGLTNERPGAPIGNLNDVINLALQNSSNRINDNLNRLGNAQNRFPDGRLNNLQNQFPPNDFNNLMDNRFPGSGGGGSGGGDNGGPNPNVTPVRNDVATTGCDVTKAILSQQEVVDIADFAGLPISNDPWTVAYFKAQQLLGQSVYLGSSTVLSALDINIIPDTQACIWVTYAPSVKTGVFVSDQRSQTSTKFMFRMP